MPQTAVHFNSDQFVKDMSDLGMDQQQVAVLSNAFTILHSEHVTREDLVDVKNEVTQVKKEIISLKSETAADFKFLSRQYDTQLIKIDAIEKVVISKIEGLEGKIDGVQKEIGGLRNEVNVEIGGLRNEMNVEIGGLRNEMNVEIGGLRNEMNIRFDGVQKEMNIKIDSLRNEMKALLARTALTIVVSISTIIGVMLAVVIRVLSNIA